MKDQALLIDSVINATLAVVSFMLLLERVAFLLISLRVYTSKLSLQTDVVSTVYCVIQLLATEPGTVQPPTTEPSITQISTTEPSIQPATTTEPGAISIHP